MAEYTIHPDAPTDSDGHPVHPDHGRPICGRSKSDRTTPTDHGRERDDYPFCLLAAGWGTDDDVPSEPGTACRKHGGNNPRGEDHHWYEHGGFSKALEGDLTDDEREALDDLAVALEDGETAREAIRRQASEAYIKYKRAGDERLLREYRQLLSTFNIVDAPDQLEVEHSGQVDREHSLDEGTKEIAREVLRRRRQDGDSE